ncbi:CRAL/TRIO domain-containing protein [Saitoella complicata NRRL Y-17804]|nr:CRAL/TRIO domain-containing protein [Saitoella complicata NRRL Y-17804]ODQ56346.1 CRAL/TRIO domain-containing protein [Saitoella complicata NRRL Y-17804]
MSTVQRLPGRPGNLTTEQETKLKELWAEASRVFGLTTTPGPSSSDSTDTKSIEKKKSGRFGLLSRKSTNKSTDPDNTDDKFNQNKDYQDAIANQTPDELRKSFWGLVKADHPDALMLRFLRARKWDVQNALIMLVSTIHWRSTEMDVDELVFSGEEGAAKAADDGTIKQLRMGKAFVHGTDKQGRPICVIRSRLHHAKDQNEESMERFTILLMESTRLMLKEPADTATIIMDLNGFSMANMDYTPLKFIIKCFEAHYPESLGVCLVHKAPWVAQGIWKIVKGWLDPVVASKIHFTNSQADLEQFISPNHIYTELGGTQKWEYTYIEPVAGENFKLADSTTREKLLAERNVIEAKFEEATKKWVAGVDTKQEREALAAELQHQYWALDPYVRARTVYDRLGLLHE